MFVRSYVADSCPSIDCHDPAILSVLVAIVAGGCGCPCGGEAVLLLMVVAAVVSVTQLAVWSKAERRHRVDR